MPSPEESHIKQHSEPNDTSVLFHKQLQQKVLPFAKPFTCKKDEPLLLRGDDAHSFYYIIKGSVEVSYTTQETKITVAIIGAGSFFGEIGFFDKGSRTRDIQATEETEILIFNQKVMNQLQEADPVLFSSFMIFLMEDICKKLRKILEEEEPLTAYAAALTKRQRQYEKSKAIPESLLRSKPWRQINQKIEYLKSQLYDLSHALQASAGEEIPAKYLQQGYAILDVMNSSLKDFNETMATDENRDYMWGFVFKEIFPYLMRGHLAARAYYKPKGYAGDFLMIEHIYLNNAKGDGKIGRLIDKWGLQLQCSRAIRGRRILLKEQLESLSKKRLETNRQFSVMNLACGPCRELFDFLRDCEYTEKIDALCVDIDTEALQYSNQRVNVFPHNASVRYMTENLVKWALGKVSHDIGAKDLIYSAGLFDYLEPRLFCRLVDRCYEHLKPGGSLLVGNYAPHNDMLFMDHLLHWNLLYRTKADLQELFANTRFGDDVIILAEQENVNLFVLAHKN
jgi:CRP-like cAMP-binding protein/SAM-dependent methyltransferase